MPPPNAGTQNRIGLGVGYDDPGDSTLRYLRNVNAAARTLMRTFGEIQNFHVNIPTMGSGGGTRGGMPEVLSQQSANEQKRRISDVADHTLVEGRRIADSMTQLANKTTDELKRMALAFQSQGHTEMVSEIDRVLQTRSAEIKYTQAELQKAMNPDPNRYYTGKHLGWPAKKGEEGAGSTANPISRPRTIDAQARNLTPEEEAERFREDAIRSHLTREQRKDAVRQWKFEQQQTRPVGSFERERDAQVETDAQLKEQRRQMNERINARATQLENQTRQREANVDSRSRGFRTQDEERQYAAAMARRTAQAETAASRAGYRTPEEQAGFEQDNMKRYNTQYAGMRAERQKRVQQQEDERRRQEWVAEQERRTQEAQVARQRQQATQWERDLETRVANERQAREEGSDRARRRAERRGYEGQGQGDAYGPEVPDDVRARNAAEERRRRKMFKYDDSLPMQGPAVPDEIRIANAESVKKVQGQIRDEVRRTQQTYDEWATDATKDLDKIEQRTATLARQYAQLARQYERGGQRRDAAAVMTHTTGARELAAEAAALRAEIERPPNMRRSDEVIRNEMTRIREEFRDTQRAHAQMSVEVSGGPPTNPYENSPRARGLFGYGGHGGAGSAIATMIQYGGIYRGIGLMKELASVSLENAKAQSEAENMMATATQQAGLLASENDKIVKSLQAQAGVGTTIGLQAVANAQRFATSAGMPGATGDISRIISNIGVSHGVTAEGLPQLIDAAMKERGRFTQEYLGKTQEKIYYDYALRNRESLEAGYPGHRTIQQDVSSLSDMEKRRAVIEEIEKRQGEFANAQATREISLAGKAERATQAWNDITAAMGRFILTSRPLIKFLELAGNLLGSVAPDIDRAGSGPGGMLTEADIQQRARQSVGSGAASASAGGFARALGDLTGVREIYELVQGIRGGGSEHFTRAIPFAGAYYAAYKDQQISNEEAYNIAQDELRRTQQGQFRTLQKAGRVVYSDARGQEYTQRELDALGHSERGRVLSNFNFGTGQGYRIETEEEYNKRLDKVFKERIRLYHEVQAAEANINKVEPLLQGQLQGQVAAGLAPDNPFLKQMSEMDGIAEKIKETWGGFSKEVQNSMTQLETGNILFDTQKSRVDNIVAAQKELTEAKKLELDATIEITAQDERKMRVLGARLRAAEQIPKLYLEEKELSQRRAASPFEREQTGREALHRIWQLMPTGFGPDGQLTPRPGRREQERVFDQALKGFTDQYPMEWVRSSQEPLAREIRNQRILLDRRERGRLWEDVDVEMRRAQVGGQAAEDAMGLLNQIPGLRARSAREGKEQGLTGDALTGYANRVKDMYNSQILAITGSLGANELTPELRKARIDALREDAASRLRAETEAQSTRIKMVTFLAGIYAELSGFKEKVGKGEEDISTNPEGEPEKRAKQNAAELLVRVSNETTAQIKASALLGLPGVGLAAAASSDSRNRKANPWGLKIQGTMQGASQLATDPFAGL
jgi:hypothetical protein